MSPVKALSRILSLAGAMCFGFGALWALRLAAAETVFRQGGSESPQRAMALQGTAVAGEFAQRLADRDPSRARPILDYIVQVVNPRSSAGWIELGQLDEAEGDSTGAERCFLQAAAVDHQYLPAWTLANFYFRRGEPEQFWPWAARAASLSADRLADSDLVPLLRLCDGFEADPERLLAHFAGARRIQAAYLRFLIAESRLDDAQKVALKMTGDHSNDPYLIDLADRQLRAGHPESAVPLWNAASGLPAIEPARGRPLFNGELTQAPMNLGFDWYVMRLDGIEPTWRPGELVFDILGSQPERCVMLEQAVYLIPVSFRLRFDYKTGGSPSSGIHWALNSEEGPEIAPSPDWREAAFDLPRAKGMSTLQLIYRRAPGTARIEERIEIRRLILERVAVPGR